MTAMRDPTTIDEFRRFFRGNEEAVALAMMVIRIADVWDDLVDQDCPVKPDDINEAFIFATCALPRNRFYRQHMDELLPVLELGVLNWMAANRLHATGERKALEIAHVVRHGIGDLFIHMARLIGGMQWGIDVAPQIKLLVQNDTLDEFLQE